MRRVIDFHAHMGDIFTGRNVSFRTGLPRPEDLEDCFAENDRGGFTYTAQGKPAEELQGRMAAGQNRLKYASYENIGKTLDREGGVCSVLLPINPHTTFDEYLAASRLDSRLIPFTNPDFSRPQKDMMDKLRADIRNGAKGLKLHPVIQNVSLLDPRTLEAVELFGEAGLPSFRMWGRATTTCVNRKPSIPSPLNSARSTILWNLRTSIRTMTWSPRTAAATSPQGSRK